MAPAARTVLALAICVVIGWQTIPPAAAMPPIHPQTTTPPPPPPLPEAPDSREEPLELLLEEGSGDAPPPLHQLAEDGSGEAPQQQTDPAPADSDPDRLLLLVEVPPEWADGWQSADTEAGSGHGESTAPEAHTVLRDFRPEDGFQLDYRLITKTKSTPEPQNGTTTDDLYKEDELLPPSDEPADEDTILNFRLSVKLQRNRPTSQRTRNTTVSPSYKQQTATSRPFARKHTAPVTSTPSSDVVLSERRSTEVVPKATEAPRHTVAPPVIDAAVESWETAASPAQVTSLAPTLLTTASSTSLQPTPGSSATAVTAAEDSKPAFCQTTLICSFRVWASVCGMAFLLLVLRSLFNNFGSFVQWCCQIRSRYRRSDTMRAIDHINLGMDKKSWEKKSACSPQIKSEIESRLRQLYSRCDVTLEMVGSLSSRLGKSLNARPEAEDSLQEFRFTEPVLGADADFMVVLQVPMAPTTAGGRELPRYVLEGVPPYRTLSPSAGRRTQGPARPPLRRLWLPCGADGAPADGASDAGLALHEFSPRPDTALTVCPLTAPTPLTGRPADGKPATDKPADGKPANGKPANGKPATDKPADGKPADGKPATGGAGKKQREPPAGTATVNYQQQPPPPPAKAATVNSQNQQTLPSQPASTSEPATTQPQKQQQAVTDDASKSELAAAEPPAAESPKAEPPISEPVTAEPPISQQDQDQELGACAAPVIVRAPSRLLPDGWPAGVDTWPAGVDTWPAGVDMVRSEPDGETPRLQRSVSSKMSVLRRYPRWESARLEDTPPGFAHVQLHLDRVLPEDRQWWKEALSEPMAGARYFSSKKARQLMGGMFENLELVVEQDRQSMSVVDRCLADYRGEPSYEKEVLVRGPAVTLRLTQRDDRAIAGVSLFQNVCCHWLSLCCSVILLLPFCVWICLTGGSWPVRKCSGGACCSIYYVVTLLVPMLLVLPALLLLQALPRSPGSGWDDEQLHVYAVIAYVVLFALCAALFVCVSQCFFKLPTIFYGDFVTALVCPEWPDDALPFKTRSRQWPTRYEVDGIVRQGCHLVPKPPQPCRCLAPNGTASCDDAHLLWRYSFSKAEVRLSRSLPEHYRRAYMALKWLVKKYVTRCSCPMYGEGSNMRSYYLKTVLFWELDLAGAVEWSEGVEEALLKVLAGRVLQYVRERHLPHFFIPKINLLEELTESDFQSVGALMEKIVSNPAPLLNMPHLKWKMCTIGMCEAIFCTPGRDFQSEMCCNYASRLPSVW